MGPPDWSPAPDRDGTPAGEHLLARLLRPSVVIIAVLGLIFIVTAYASHPGRTRQPTVPTSPPTVTPLSTAPANAGTVANPATGNSPLVGGCILPLMGYDAVVACNQAGARMVTAAVDSGSECPAGTSVYQLEGRSQLVCLAPGS